MDIANSELFGKLKLANCASMGACKMGLASLNPSTAYAGITAGVRNATRSSIISRLYYQ
jgi:hypothetical protein